MAVHVWPQALATGATVLAAPQAQIARQTTGMSAFTIAVRTMASALTGQVITPVAVLRVTVAKIVKYLMHHRLGALISL
jgi:hypothetical protein